MNEPWKVFFAAWKRRMAAPPRSGDAGQRQHLAAAIRGARVETGDHLRYDLDWSLINSRVLADRLAEAAEDWMWEQTLDPDNLRTRLRAAWISQTGTRRVEQERRRVTEEVLAGARSGSR